MAEDKSDNNLEEEGAKDGKKDEAAQPQKGGLSTSLLIKVAVGLGVVLIAMLVAFFLLSSSPETDTAEVEAEVSEADSQALNEETSDASTDVAPANETIELPSLTETATTSETTPATQNNSEVAGTSPATTAKTPTDKVLSEMVALQKQLDTMQQENQKLIKRVEELTRESETLRQRLPGSTSSSASPINDEQAGNNSEVPLYYRENRYSNTPQPELKPQWGEFQQAR
jgi:flagellar basal body-associated protein FliL